MSKANPDVDLGSLARPTADLSARPPRRRWLFVAVPLFLLAGFLAVLATSLGDWLTGAMEVEIVRPMPVAGGAKTGGATGAVVVQAAGWIEPDPFPIRVSALTAGVVQEVLVQESDRVEAGSPIARLVDEDAALSCRQAQAMLGEAAAELARMEAELLASKESFDAALAVRERASTAKADLEGKRAGALHREQAALEARSRLSAAESELEVQRFLAASGAAGPRAVELAEARLAETKAEVEVMAADAELARSEARAAEAVLERAERDLELRTEDKLRVSVAEANVAMSRAKRDQVQVACDEAKLRLERTTVRAPGAGVVLQRLVGPGAAVTSEDAAVAILYDPHSVRVRVDVPQGDIAKLSVGQKVLVEAQVRQGKPYTGEVTRIVRQADINKVTLQAHVRIEESDELLRPEMLVQARFLGLEGALREGTENDAVRIPADLVVQDNKVWVLDALGHRAELREVRLGAELDGACEVLEGLNLSDKVIATRLDDLAPGRSVTAKPAGRSAAR
jgi:RND family efflux transporter MFP subunit